MNHPLISQILPLFPKNAFFGRIFVGQHESYCQGYVGFIVPYGFGFGLPDGGENYWNICRIQKCMCASIFDYHRQRIISLFLRWLANDQKSWYFHKQPSWPLLLNAVYRRNHDVRFMCASIFDDPNMSLFSAYQWAQQSLYMVHAQQCLCGYFFDDPQCHL